MENILKGKMKSGGHKNVRRTEETKCAFDVPLVWSLFCIPLILRSSQSLGNK